MFREARRVAPSIVYLPRINSWWEVTPETFRATLFSVVYSLPPTTPLLVLATAECPFNKLPVAIKELFKQVRKCMCVCVCVCVCVSVSVFTCTCTSVYVSQCVQIILKLCTPTLSNYLLSDNYVQHVLYIRKSGIL